MLVAPTHVKELLVIDTDSRPDVAVFGASVTLTDLEYECIALAKRMPAEQTSGFVAIAEQLR